MSCSVCEIRAISSTFTLFGKHHCPESYLADYIGFGFASYYTSSYRRTNFICIDDGPQQYARSMATNPNEGRLHPMELGCSTLPCPPYTGGREVQCAQCSYRSTCPLYVDGQDCVSECPTNQYADSSKLCRPCDPECVGCTDAGPFACVDCLHVKNDSRCVSRCPAGKTANSSGDCIPSTRTSSVLFSLN